MRHPLMPFENNSTLKKWHMTITPPKIDKYDTHKKCCRTKMTHLAKKCLMVICQGLGRVIFLRESLNLQQIQTNGQGISKSSFSSLCLIVGIGYINMVLIVRQKTSNVSFEMPFLSDADFVRCHFCDVPFMLGGILVRGYF